ncbi:hypothetical protein [Campylobacter showae]|uniref:hypothetical protein n=1 Tax=Campylobacter showae TaxID=204 RepID=UPI0026EBEFBA|nr:hypothetical protein [Campylobacter showae]
MQISSCLSLYLAFAFAALVVVSSAHNLQPRIRPNHQTACRLQSNLTAHFCFYDSVVSGKFEPSDALSNLNLTFFANSHRFLKFDRKLPLRQISAILRRDLST